MTLQIDTLDHEIYQALVEAERNPLFGVEPEPPLPLEHPLVQLYRTSDEVDHVGWMPVLQHGDKDLLALIRYDLQLALVREPRREDAIAMLEELIERASKHKIKGTTFYSSYLDCGCALGTMLLAHGTHSCVRIDLSSEAFIALAESYAARLRSAVYYAPTGCPVDLLVIEQVAWPLEVQDNDVTEDEFYENLRHDEEVHQRSERLLIEAAQAVLAQLQ